MGGKVSVFLERPVWMRLLLDIAVLCPAIPFFADNSGSGH